ncbi:MAG: iron ABC transporter permease [Planctomycetota bacterium]|nr:iron ABC transporter permease [Planctomycetota bacterium]
MPRSWRVGLAIAGALVLLVVISPLGYLISEIVGDPASAWRAARRASVWSLTARSLALAAAVTATALTLATVLSWLVARTNLPGGRRWIVALAMPLAIPSFLAAEAFRRSLGITGFTGAWMAMTLITFPYALLPLEAAFRRCSIEQELAARSLGTSAWETFRRATLPQVLPTLEWTGLLIALYALSDYGAVAMLEVRVLTFAIESRRAEFDPAGAAALSGILTLLALACLVGISRLRGARGAIVMDAQTESRFEAKRLRAWRWPAAGFCAAVTVMSVGLPLAMVINWWTQGLGHGDATVLSTLGPAASPAWRSLGAGLATALIAAVASLPIVLIIHRVEYVKGSSWMRRLGGLALIGYGLPGVVIGFALVRASLRLDIGLYQTLPLLLMGYAVKCVAEALGPASASARRLHPDRLDAAIGLGATFTRTWMRIGWPLIAPGVAAGAALAFLTVVKELPITLILRPTGFDTLAFELFDMLNEARHTTAAPMALVILLISGAVVWGLIGSQRD